MCLALAIASTRRRAERQISPAPAPAQCVREEVHESRIKCARNACVLFVLHRRERTAVCDSQVTRHARLRPFAQSLACDVITRCHVPSAIHFRLLQSRIPISGLPSRHPAAPLRCAPCSAAAGELGRGCTHTPTPTRWATNIKFRHSRAASTNHNRIPVSPSEPALTPAPRKAKGSNVISKLFHVTIL